MLLHAFFLAAVQVLVYAGAVMVLFLFVIMLLDLKEEERRKIKAFGVRRLGVVVGRRDCCIFFTSRCMRIRTVAPMRPPATSKAAPMRLGKLLFTQLPAAV